MSSISAVADAFYERNGDGYRATELTQGPWDLGFQHASPPAALIGREVEALPDSAEFRVGRITYEILRAVPIGEMNVSARITRPGRRVQMFEATISDDKGEAMLARGWRIRTTETDVSAAVVPPRAEMPPIEEAAERPFFPVRHEIGYQTAIDLRFNEGGWIEPGPARVWMRPARPLIAGEQPSPLQRVLLVADCGNGVSATLDFEKWLFINVDLTIHLERLPQGDWVGLDAVTLPEPDGTGASDTVLHDERGRIGRAQQTLLVARR